MKFTKDWRFALECVRRMNFGCAKQHGVPQFHILLALSPHRGMTCGCNSRLHGHSSLRKTWRKSEVRCGSLAEKSTWVAIRHTRDAAFAIFFVQTAEKSCWFDPSFSRPLSTVRRRVGLFIFYFAASAAVAAAAGNFLSRVHIHPLDSSTRDRTREAESQNEREKKRRANFANELDSCCIFRLLPADAAPWEPKTN